MCRQLLDGTICLDRLDIDAWHHTVTHGQIGELQYVLEQFDLVLLVFVVGGIFEQCCQVLAVELFDRATILYLLSHHSENQIRNARCQLSNGEENDVEKEDRNGECSEVEIGIEFEHRLGDKLAQEDDDDGREGGFEQHRTVCYGFPADCRADHLDQRRHIE